MSIVGKVRMLEYVVVTKVLYSSELWVLIFMERKNRGSVKYEMLNEDFRSECHE